MRTFMSTTRRSSIAVAGIVAAAALTCRAPATRVVESTVSGGFVVTLGNDTMSAESYTRVGNRIEGAVMRRVPRTVVVRYTMTLSATGLPSRLDYTTRLADGAMLPGGARSVAVTFTGDSALTEIVRDSVITTRVAASNAYPDLDGSVLMYGLPIAALREMSRDSARFVAYLPGAPSGDRTPVVRRDPNTYWLYSDVNPIALETDDDGLLLAVDATRTTFRVRSRRQAPVDVAALATDFARREAIAGPVTALSPRDTVQAMIGGVQFWVDYSRPAARGRRIFGLDGVLGDTLWRTGANRSTQFRADAAISFAGQTLPAGTYALMTLAVPGRYQLIFYEGAIERLRVPLEATALAPPVERFTIAIDAAGERSGIIRLRWDTMELSAPFNLSASPAMARGAWRGAPAGTSQGARQRQAGR